MIFDLRLSSQAHAGCLSRIVLCGAIHAVILTARGNEAVLGKNVVTRFVVGATVGPIGKENTIRLIVGAIALLSALATCAELLLGLGLLGGAVFPAGLLLSVSHSPASEQRIPRPWYWTPPPPRPSRVRK